jgi:hypothetical protein
METPETQSLNKKDILAKFGDRVLWHPEKVEKQYLGLDDNLTERNLVGTDFPERIRETKLGDSNTFDQFAHQPPSFFQKYDYCERAAKPISSELLKSGLDPMTLTAVQFMERFKMKGMDPGYQERLNLKLLKGDFTALKADQIGEAWVNEEKIIGELGLTEEKDNKFTLHHRLVKPKYRDVQNRSNERLSNILLKAGEQIVQSYADKDGKEKTLEITTTQLDVILWAYNNGYEPKTNQDKEKFIRIMNADSNLVIVEKYNVFEKDKWQEGVDLYDQKNGSVSITLEKKINPNPNTIAKNIRKKVQSV